MEELKPFEQILDPDFRATCRGYTLEVLYKLAAAHDLTPAAPRNVRHQFEIARHAYIYSNLYTPLCGTAELYAALAVEHALKLRYDASPHATARPAPRGLKRLLSFAATEGWITDAGFEFDFRELTVTDDGVEYQEIPPERRARPTDIVVDVLPRLRNSAAHGQPRMTLETVNTALQRAAEIINQLYPAAGPAP